MTHYSRSTNPPYQHFTSKLFHETSEAVYNTANIGHIWQMVKEGNHTKFPAPTLRDILYPTQFTSEPLPEEATPDYETIFPTQYSPKIPTDHPGNGRMFNRPKECQSIKFIIPQGGIPTCTKYIKYKQTPLHKLEGVMVS